MLSFVIVDSALVLDLLNTVLEVSDLGQDELPHEFGHLLLCDFSRFLLTENKVALCVGFFEIGVDHTFDLGSSHDLPDELFGHLTGDDSAVVFVHGPEDVGVHLVELVGVDHDVVEVLDGFLKVGDVGLGSATLLIPWVLLLNRIPVGRFQVLSCFELLGFFLPLFGFQIVLGNGLLHGCLKVLLNNNNYNHR